MEASFSNPLVLGVFAGIGSCILFLVFHQVTISNIWFSSPFMLLIAGLSGFLITKSYYALFDDYKIWFWFGYNFIYIIGLITLGLLSVIIFSPKYTSDEILNAGGAPPSGLITGAFPLTFISMIVLSFAIVLAVNQSLDNFLLVLVTTAILFITLGLNVSILGFVEVSPQHQYLVQKFMAMNVMLGVGFSMIFSILKALS